MATIDDAFLESLISCPKRIGKAERRKLASQNRSLRNNVRLVSECGKYSFEMFIRQSDEFTEDFSFGLKWTNASEHSNINRPIILLRVQGPHDSKAPTGTDVHHDYHIHQITAEDITARRYRDPPHKNLCDEYHNFEQAGWYFVRRCGIMNPEEHLDYPFNHPDTLGASMYDLIDGSE